MKFLLFLAMLPVLFGSGCGTSSNPSASDKASEKGYNCIGTEPFWNVKVEKTGITFLLAGEEPVEYPSASAQKQGAASLYQTTIKGSRLQVSITEAPCSDGMSDTRYPYTVKVEKDGVSYSGCAFLIGQNPMREN